MTTKATPTVGGIPLGGVDGDIIIRNNAAEGGYEWAPNPGQSFKIELGATAFTIVDPIDAINFPWGTPGEVGMQGTISGLPFMKVAARDAAAPAAEYPGLENDYIVNFSTDSTEKVHIMADTFSGLDLAGADGDIIRQAELGAQKNPPVFGSGATDVSNPAGVTSLRSLSPSDVITIASTVDVGNYPQVTQGQKDNAPNRTVLASWSPRDVYDVVLRYSDGDDNPPDAVVTPDTTDPGSVSAVKLWSPNRIRQLVRNQIWWTRSKQLGMRPAEYIYQFTHGFDIDPIMVQMILKCRVADHGYSIGDIIVSTCTGFENFGARGLQIVYPQSPDKTIFAMQDAPPLIMPRTLTSNSSLSTTNDWVECTPTSWYVEFRLLFVGQQKTAPG